MKSIYYSIALVLMLIICGCGSESNTGQGKTVYISAALTDGKTGAAFATYSSHVGSNATLDANPMNFTIHSYVYPGTTKIPASDVVIDSVSFTFTPLITPSCVSPNLNNNLWFSSLKWAGRLTPGGDAKIENVPIFTKSDLPDILTISSNSVCSYDVKATFSGREVNTGTSLSDSITFTGMVFR